MNYSIIARTAFAMCLMAIVTAGSVFAQGQRQRMSAEEMQERFEKQTQEMVIALELTAEQKPMFMEIMEAGHADRLGLMEDMQGGGDRSAMREKMAALNSATTEALTAVLTEEQMKKYNSILEERRGQGRRNGPPGDR